MKLPFTLSIILFCALPKRAVAQSPTPLTSANYVTEIVTNYGGYWRSGNGTSPNAAVNAVKPDNSHLLLAFVVNSGTVTTNGTTSTLANKYFSTGVNDALLQSKGLAYTAARFQALPASTYSGTVNVNAKVALGQLYDGVSGGASSPPPASGYAQYLADGTQGLNLGTGVANLPVGTLTFALNSLSAAAIGDNVPDILITQIADPSKNTVDSYQFLDASGAQVAGSKSLSANFNNAPVVGNWTADFYEASQNPMMLTSNLTSTDRTLRLLAVDLATFGITASNAGSVRQFQITLSGDSDQAFIAYNTNAVTTNATVAAPLPVTLVAFTGAAQGTGVRLSWQTANEQRSAYFEAEASADGLRFVPVGRVAAAGTTQQQRAYQLDCPLPPPGLAYYRLRQVDLDGTAHYSPVVVVRTGAAAVAVYPSIFTDHLTVQLPAAKEAALVLLAADGRVVRQQPLPLGAPAQQVALPDVASLPAGLYLLRATVDGQSSLHRVVKH